MIIALINLSTQALSQNSIKNKNRSFFIPQSTVVAINSNFHWFIYDGFKGKFIDQAYISANIRYNRYIQIVIINKTKYNNSHLHNKFSDVYFNFTKNFKANTRAPIFKYVSFVNLKVGKLEFFPTYSNVQLILENADKFIEPRQIYGACIHTITPFLRDKSLNINLTAHTGDLIYRKVKQELINLNMNYTKLFKYNLGVSVQVGIAEGSRHIVNFAHFLYQPKLKEMQFDFRIGKLPTHDESPYGIHVGFSRRFKYLVIGGYYEKRINQHFKGEIAGVQWNIIGPPKLAKLVSTFNFAYDFNMNTIWMWIPILKIDIKNK